MTEIKYDELSRSLDKFKLVDVRKPEELKDYGCIPGSFNIPMQELEHALSLPSGEFKRRYKLSHLCPDDSYLVITCRSGRRVQLAQEILSKYGFEKNRLYYGSFLDWIENGGEIQTKADEEEEY